MKTTITKKQMIEIINETEEKLWKQTLLFSDKPEGKLKTNTTQKWAAIFRLQRKLGLIQ